jgi:hypothetical protein
MSLFPFDCWFLASFRSFFLTFLLPIFPALHLHGLSPIVDESCACALRGISSVCHIKRILRFIRRDCMPCDHCTDAPSAPHHCLQ